MLNLEEGTTIVQNGGNRLGEPDGGDKTARRAS